MGYAEQIVQITIEQMQLLQEKSKETEQPDLMLAYSDAIARLTEKLDADLVLLADRPQSRRLLGSKGLYIRTEESED